MKKWAFLTVLLMAIGIFSVCAKLQDQTTKTDKVTTMDITPYVPPMPTLPNTPKNSLGQIIQDTVTPYTVAAKVDDGKLLHSLFPPEATFYIQNVDTTFLWGDGTSTAHTPYATHTYSRAGDYTVVCQMEISFRGGSLARINCESPISVTEPSSVPIINISTNSIGPFDGAPDKAEEVVTFTACNTGGRDVLLRPFVRAGIVGSSDLSWITITPKEYIVPNDNVPVPFTIRLKWSNCPIVELAENSTMKIGFTLDILTDGWYLPYTSASVVPGG